MSKEKNRQKKKHHKDSTNENEDERSESQLFSQVDAKSVEISGYTVGHGAPQTDQFMQERAIPTGVVGVDESVKLPTSPSRSHQQHYDTKAYTTLRPNENYNKEPVHLPPILNQHNQHYPYEYFHPPPVDHNFGYLSHPYPIYHEHRSPNYHHHHHHHHHHKHHHHKHVKEVETYDPRWWYMPVKSVHRPKLWRPPEYHYSPPKWYESSSNLSRMSLISQELKSSPQKYVDCRCEVCRPSKETPPGTKWIVSE